MSLIIILLAIFIERVTNFIHPMRNHYWLEEYAEKIIRFFGHHRFLGVIIALLPLMLIIGMLQWYLDHRVFGLLGWLFDLIILLYSLGDSRLKEHIEECYVLSTHGQEDEARALLAEHFGVVDAEELSVKVLVHAFYRASLQRLFSVLFWFVVLGPIGCVSYRAIQHLSVRLKRAGLDESAYFAKWLTFLYDWVPARLLALSFCLVGNFTDIFSEWRSSFKSKIVDTYQILYQCGHVAIHLDENPEPAVVLAQFTEANSLVNRSLFVWLVILALMIMF